MQATGGSSGWLPGLVPAAAGRSADPRRAHWIPQTVASTWALAFGPPPANRAARDRPAAAAGVLRSGGDPVAPAAAAPPVGSLSGLSSACGAGAGVRCWSTRWRPVTLSGRCAGIRWSPRRGTGRSRCTVWFRPSPPVRCQPKLARQWQQATAARDRGRDSRQTRHSRIRGPILPRCCRTRRSLSRRTAIAGSESPPISGTAAVTWPPANSRAECLTNR